MYLQFDENKKFGIEIELTSPLQERELRDRLDDLNFRVSYDGSIRCMRQRHYAYEIVSGVFPFIQESFEKIQTALDFLARQGAKVNISCGGHVHIERPERSIRGINSYGDTEREEHNHRLVFLFKNIEKEILSLQSDNRAKSGYCNLLSNIYQESGGKYRTVNFLNQNTIEFRLFSGSLDFSHWKFSIFTSMAAVWYSYYGIPMPPLRNFPGYEEIKSRKNMGLGFYKEIFSRKTKAVFGNFPGQDFERFIPLPVSEEPDKNNYLVKYIERQKHKFLGLSRIEAAETRALMTIVGKSLSENINSLWLCDPNVYDLEFFCKVDEEETIYYRYIRTLLDYLNISHGRIFKSVKMSEIRKAVFDFIIKNRHLIQEQFEKTRDAIVSELSVDFVLQLLNADRINRKRSWARVFYSLENCYNQDGLLSSFRVDSLFNLRNYPEFSDQELNRKLSLYKSCSLNRNLFYEFVFQNFNVIERHVSKKKNEEISKMWEVLLTDHFLANDFIYALAASGEFYKTYYNKPILGDNYIESIFYILTDTRNPEFVSRILRDIILFYHHSESFSRKVSDFMDVIDTLHLYDDNLFGTKLINTFRSIYSDFL